MTDLDALNAGPSVAGLLGLHVAATAGGERLQQRSRIDLGRPIADRAVPRRWQADLRLRYLPRQSQITLPDVFGAWLRFAEVHLGAKRSRLLQLCSGLDDLADVTRAVVGDDRTVFTLGETRAILGRLEGSLRYRSPRWIVPTSPDSLPTVAFDPGATYDNRADVEAMLRRGASKSAEWRRSYVAELRAQGATDQEIATRLGLTDRQVRRIAGPKRTRQAKNVRFGLDPERAAEAA